MKVQTASKKRGTVFFGAIPKVALCLAFWLCIACFMLPSTMRAEADPDMANLIGKLQDMMATNIAKAAGTNEAALLAPPLPEIPPTPWERYGWLVWLVLPFVVMVIGLVAAFLLRARKPPVLFSPAAEARSALAALQSQTEDGTVLSHVSRALRRYLVAAFWLDASETTTAEFCAGLANNAKIGPELSGVIAQFLRACDERKFSPAHSASSLDAVQQALKLVEMSEARRASRPSGYSA